MAIGHRMSDLAVKGGRKVGRGKGNISIYRYVFHIPFHHTPHTHTSEASGNKLRKELAKKRVVNANVLDYLLANPHLIPEEWKGKAVFFWGTIYRDRGDYLCVHCLLWGGVGWRWRSRWLGRDWHGDDPAAVPAS